MVDVCEKSADVNIAGAAYEVVVLGAGISGLVSASILLEQGYERVLIIDEYDHIGGNHIDRRFGDYTFDVGSFIFQSDSPLLRHFPELLPLYVPIKPTFARLNPQGRVARHPLSIREDILSAGFLETSRIALSLAVNRVTRRKQKSAKEFAEYWIGSRLLKRSGLETYIERFHGVPAERIDISFAEKRMGWIKRHASFRQIGKRLDPSRLLPGRKRSSSSVQLARPREGFGYLYQAAVERLLNGGARFLLGADLKSVAKSGDGFHIQVGDRLIETARVVSTIPLHRVQDLCNTARRVELPTVTLISLFFSFSGNRGFEESILYNFSHAGAWKRLTMHSDFYGKVGEREYFSVEVNAHHVRESIEAAEQDFRQHTSSNGLFLGDLRLEGSHVLPNAYPIYTDRADEKAHEAVTALRALGIESFGRQGGFNYQPTATVSTVEAEAVLRSSA